MWMTTFNAPNRAMRHAMAVWIGSAAREGGLVVSIKAKSMHAHDSAISLLSIYPGDILAHAHKEACMTMFTAAVSVIVRAWKWTKCPVTREWLIVYAYSNSNECRVTHTNAHKSPKHIMWNTYIALYILPYYIYICVNM